MIKVTSTPADDQGCGWYHLSPKRKAKAALKGMIQADWVVVGAGFTGLSAARRLANNFPNDSVLLIEAQEVGYGASGRNSGFLIDLPHDIGAPDYIGDLKTAEMYIKLNHAAQDILKGLIKEFNIDCKMDPRGKYQCAVEPRGLEILKSYMGGLDRLGQDFEIIEEKDLPEHIGTSFYKKALFTPGTILVQPAALVKGLAESLPKNCTLYEYTTITEFTASSKGVVLNTADGAVINAKKLVLTNNAFASNFGYLKGKLLPIFTYSSMTRPLSEEEQKRLGGTPTWGIIPADPFGTTLRRTSDNRILVRNSFSYNNDGKSKPHLLPKVRTRHRHSYENRFPMLSGIEFEYTWGGSLCMSRNHEGFFGELEPNVYGALCCNGLGTTKGTITGALLADWLAGDKNEMIEFLLTSPSPIANPPEPILSLGINLNLIISQYRAGIES